MYWKSSRVPLQIAAIIFVLLAGAAPTPAEDKTVTVNGMLEQVPAIPNETTGWAIKLDAELEVQPGVKLKTIEIAPNGKKLKALKGAKVQAAGTLTRQHGIKRGEYPVIVLQSIKALK
jgi:hypothetical protein